MKLDCEVIRDLLPLYAEQMVSDKSKVLIDAHLAECEECRTLHEAMAAPEPQVEFTKEPAQSFRKYVKKQKLHHGLKVALITAAVVLAVVVIRLIMVGGLMAFLAFDSMMSPIEVDTDVNNYSLYMGENAKEEYRSKWGMDESIFPSEIRSDMDVQEYKMVYYNPWDAQYLSYLTVTYEEAAYTEELARLQAYASTEYIGNYSVTGFADAENPLAMYADDYQGFVYAIATPNMENTITYVELIFCNYFMDLEYMEYMPAEYFPENFNAAMNNPYEEKMMEQN